MLMTIKGQLNRALRRASDEKRPERHLNRAVGSVTGQTRREAIAEAAHTEHAQPKIPAGQTELDDIVVVSDVLW